MIKYFLDTEFYEKPNTIDLISIGIVCEDGTELYLLNSDVNLSAIWNEHEWLKDNVLKAIFNEYNARYPLKYTEFTLHKMRRIFSDYGTPIYEIRSYIADFVGFSWTGKEFVPYNTVSALRNRPQFWGYYADYDWVVFCWIFGSMMQLPKGFPMFCMDIKQLMETFGLTSEWKDEVAPDPGDAHHALVDARWNKTLYLEVMKEIPWATQITEKINALVPPKE